MRVRGRAQRKREKKGLTCRQNGQMTNRRSIYTLRLRIFIAERKDQGTAVYRKSSIFDDWLKKKKDRWGQ